MIVDSVVVQAASVGAVALALGVRTHSFPLVGIAQAAAAAAAALAVRHTRGLVSVIVLSVLGAGIFLVGEAARVGIHRRRIPGPLRQGADLRGQIRRDAVVVVALGMIAAAAVGLLSSGAMVSVLLPLGLLTVPVLILFVALSLRRAGQQ